ncbi:hypothetical protein BsWGS_16801 [Bradybaena similaris]
MESEDMSIKFAVPGDDNTGGEMPVEVVLHAYEIMVVLTALTVFSCVFVLICVCTEEKATVSEKANRFNAWKAKRKATLNQPTRSAHKVKSTSRDALAKGEQNINKSQRISPDRSGIEELSVHKQSMRGDRLETISELPAGSRDKQT